MPRAKTLLYEKGAVEAGKPAGAASADETGGARREAEAMNADEDAVVGGGANGGRDARGRDARGAQRDMTVFPKADVDLARAVLVTCCVDDTDDLSGETSTGFVAEQIASAVAGLGGQVVLGITRHQLFLGEGVPYTSHNSAMCFSAVMPDGTAFALRARAVGVIARHKADLSDPGLCVAELPFGSVGDEVGAQIAVVSDFALKAKRTVCTKHEAYEVVRDIPWIALSEHGGTGDGVIGALAGVGLRLRGDDGRFRGKWDLERLAERAGLKARTDEDGSSVVTAGEFCSALESLAMGSVQVLTADGSTVGGATPLVLFRAAKPIMRGGALTFVVDMHGGIARPCAKDDLGEMGNEAPIRRGCVRFVPDNDLEECAPDPDDSCRNCLYRRWLPHGFDCMAEHAAVGADMLPAHVAGSDAFQDAVPATRGQTVVAPT